MQFWWAENTLIKKTLKYLTNYKLNLQEEQIYIVNNI